MVCASLFTLPFFASIEDAKRLAIKEEQYDPGYEDAYGGAYIEKGPEGGQAQSQINGHCTFSSVETTGNQRLALLKLGGGQDTEGLMPLSLATVAPSPFCIMTTKQWQ